MVRIRRFGIVRTANMAAALYLVLSLIFVAIFGAFGLLGLAVAPEQSRVGFGAGVAGLLIFGIVIVGFYTVVGWIFTAIACALYNVVAGWIGGIELHLEGPGVGPGGGTPAYGTGYGAAPGYGAYPAPGYPVPGYPAPGYPAPGGAPMPAPMPSPWQGPGQPPAPPAR